MEFYEALRDYAQTVGASLTQHVLMYLDERFFNAYCVSFSS